jgi:hypothetical protein
VFTKTDKQSPAKTKASIALFLEALAPAVPEVLASSAKSRDGRLEILRAIGRELAK